MDKEKLSLDDLLSQQRTLPHIATVKPTAGDRVVVTPVADGGECACAHAITVEKSDIEAVTPTGETHTCCGEKLLAVEVEFVNKTVAEIFRQLSERAAKSSSHTARSPFIPARLREDYAGSHAACREEFSSCMESCPDLHDPGECVRRCLDTLRLCQILETGWHEP